MHFDHFKDLVEYILKHLDCPSCRTKYQECDIFMMGGLPEEEMLHLRCSKCKSELTISVDFTNEIVINPRMHRSIRTNGKDKIITTNDVLDMSNFLKNIKGDFTSYIKI